MRRIPWLWTAAYSPGRNAVWRALARCTLYARDLIRHLALLDHTPFTSI